MADESQKQSDEREFKRAGFRKLMMEGVAVYVRNAAPVQGPKPRPKDTTTTR